MKITATLPDHGAIVEAVLEGFVQAAMVMIQTGVVPPYPDAVPSVRYQDEPSGSEEWLLPNQVIEAGWGDCEDLVIWAAAGDRVTGTDPSSRAMLVKTGKGLLHCVVQHGDGAIEDVALRIKNANLPQAKLRALRNAGMGGWGMGAIATAVGPGGGAMAGPGSQRTPAIRVRDHTSSDQSGPLGPNSGLAPAAAPLGPIAMDAAGLARKKLYDYMKNPGYGYPRITDVTIDLSDQNPYGTQALKDAATALRQVRNQGLDYHPGEEGRGRGAVHAEMVGDPSGLYKGNLYGKGVRTDGPPDDWVQVQYPDGSTGYVPPSQIYDPNQGNLYDPYGQYETYQGYIPDMYSQSMPGYGESGYAGWQSQGQPSPTYEDLYGGFGAEAFGNDGDELMSRGGDGMPYDDGPSEYDDDPRAYFDDMQLVEGDDGDGF
jgi:hypothetical protein